MIWCINKISEGNIYTPSEDPQIKEWNTHNVPSRLIYLNKPEHIPEEKISVSKGPHVRPTFSPMIFSSFNKIQTEILNKIDTEDFDARDCLNLFERPKILPLISYKIFASMELLTYLLKKN